MCVQLQLVEGGRAATSTVLTPVRVPVTVSHHTNRALTVSPAKQVMPPPTSSTSFPANMSRRATQSTVRTSSDGHTPAGERRVDTHRTRRVDIEGAAAEWKSVQPVRWHGGGTDGRTPVNGTLCPLSCNRCAVYVKKSM